MRAVRGYLEAWKADGDAVAACCCLLIVLGMLPRAIHAQGLGLSLEVSAGWSAVSSGGITDPGVPTSSVSYADHWLGRQTGAPSVGARLAVELPLGLGAFVGYHITEFHQMVDSTLHESLYGRWLYSWADVERFSGTSRTEGVDVGITFAPTLRWTVLEPFVSLGIRQQKFQSSTDLSATGAEIQDVRSRSAMNTGADWGPLIAGGVMLPLGGVALSLRVEHSRADPPVAERQWEKRYLLPDGRRGPVRAFFTVPDGQAVRLSYYQLMVGLQWRIR